MLGTVYESFHETSFLNPDPKFVGFPPHQRVLADRTVHTVLPNSIVATLGVVLLQNILGFLTALLLNQQLPMQGVLRAIVLLPFILPGVVAAILWRFMYDPQLGLVNSLLLQVGLIDHSIAWLADSRMAMASVIVAAVWKGFPFSMLIYLAALQNVDQSQIEAATLDGAGPVRRLFDVTLPAIRDVVVVNIVLTLILTLNYGDIIWALPKRGPQSVTHYYPTEILETRLRPRPLGVALGPRGGGPPPRGACGMKPPRPPRLILMLLQLLLAAAVLLPFFWMFSVSLKPATEPFAIPARLWPSSPTIDNYVTAFRPEFRTYFFNSLVVSLSTVIITVTLGLLAAYSFTRAQLAAMSALVGLVVLAQMFPHSAIIIPIYKMMRSAGLLNTYWSRIFWDIVVPLSRPGLIATSVYVLIVTWQEFLFALSFTSTKDMRTLPVGLNDFIGQYGIRYGELMASSVMVSLPVMAIFFFLQRYFVAGITAGAVKG